MSSLSNLKTRFLAGDDPIDILAIGSTHIDMAIKDFDGSEKYDTASCIVRYPGGVQAMIDVCRQSSFGYVISIQHTNIMTGPSDTTFASPMMNTTHSSSSLSLTHVWYIPFHCLFTSFSIFLSHRQRFKKKSHRQNNDQQYNIQTCKTAMINVPKY